MGAPPRSSKLGAARGRNRRDTMGRGYRANFTRAGAASQNEIGTGVIGGMISDTVHAIFFVPLFYLLVRSFVARRKKNFADAR
jgi:hypothetical protein